MKLLLSLLIMICLQFIKKFINSVVAVFIGLPIKSIVIVSFS